VNDEYQPDEVIFKLIGLDQEFEAKVRQYAGAGQWHMNRPNIKKNTKIKPIRLSSADALAARAFYRTIARDLSRR
jgi:hypothetical protein